MSPMSFVWGVILFVPLSGIVAAIYLGLALGRRGVPPVSPAVARTGGPSGMLVALLVVGAVLGIVVLGSMLVLLTARAGTIGS